MSVGIRDKQNRPDLLFFLQDSMAPGTLELACEDRDGNEWFLLTIFPDGSAEHVGGLPGQSQVPYDQNGDWKVNNARDD